MLAGNTGMFLATKFENAQRVLSASSPWLEPAIERMGVTVVDDNDLSVFGFPNMWFFVGEKFLANSTPDELLISLDYAMMQALYDSHKKASSISMNHPNNISGLAVTLEINSSLIKHWESINQSDWTRQISKEIDESYFDVFNVRKVPKVPDSFWLPDDFSFERGLSAEKYAKLLVDLSNQMERDWLEEKISSKVELSQIRKFPQENKKSENTEDSLNRENEPLKTDDTLQESDNNQEDIASIIDNKPDDKSIYDMLKEGYESSDRKEDDDYISFNDSLSDASDVIARSQIRFSSLNEIIDNPDLSELISMSGGGEGYEGISYQDKNDMEREMAKSIDEYEAENPGKNKNELGLYIEWSHSVARKSRARWKKKLNSTLTPLMGKAVQSGETDLSFAKRNPNQQPDQPLMMAMVTYAPHINVVVDASPSMLKHQEETITEISAVLQKVFLKYSTPADIALVDNKVRYVFSTQTPTKRLKKALSRTYSGGSEGFGYTIGRIIRKGIKYKGTYPKPDLVIIVTDCFFHDWPFPEKGKLPNKDGMVLIISTEPWDKVKHLTPPWVKPKKNFFEAF